MNQAVFEQEVGANEYLLRLAAARLDGSFDAVHTDRVLQHVSDPDAALASAARLLRPGGRAVFAEPDWRTLVIDHAEPALPEAFTPLHR